MIKQYLFTRPINGSRFSVLIPCVDWNDANDIAAKTGMKAEGSDVHLIPCVPIPQFMTFCESLVEGGELRWKQHAQEQIEAFLCAGWPEEPHEEL